jgi:hypothetical protein
VAIGPSRIFEATEKDLASADAIEKAMDTFLKGVSYWDGTRDISVPFFLNSVPFPNLAVQSELRRRFTEGEEDHWSGVRFEQRITLWCIMLTP